MTFRKKEANEIRLDGQYAYIQIQSSGSQPVIEARIDAADMERVVSSGLHWYVSKNWKTTYVLAALPRGGEKRRVVSLHRFILDTHQGQAVDHVNGDGLDNTQGNLRLASCAQNAQNRRLYSTNKTGFKGVYQRGRKWAASIGVNRRSINLGTFETPELAAAAYNEAAAKHFGEYARLNAV